MQHTEERFDTVHGGLLGLEHFNRYYFVLNQFDLKDKIVLDIASGEGYGSDLLSRKAKEVCGVDISEEAVLHASNKYKKSNLNYFKGDACEIPFEDNKFDVVVSFETIEHHDKHSEMIREIKRVLKPDGFLIISTPDKIRFSLRRGLVNPFHIKELSYEEFNKLLSQYFSKVKFFNQFLFGGSVITAAEESDIVKTTAVLKDADKVHDVNPDYLLAVAAETDISFKFSQILYSNDSCQMYDDDHINNLRYLWEKEFRRKPAWIIGNSLLAPLKKIKKVFSR